MTFVYSVTQLCVSQKYGVLCSIACVMHLTWSFGADLWAKQEVRCLRKRKQRRSTCTWDRLTRTTAADPSLRAWVRAEAMSGAGEEYDQNCEATELLRREWHCCCCSTTSSPFRSAWICLLWLPAVSRWLRQRSIQTHTETKLREQFSHFRELVWTKAPWVRLRKFPYTLSVPVVLIEQQTREFYSLCLAVQSNTAAATTRLTSSAASSCVPHFAISVSTTSTFHSFKWWSNWFSDHLSLLIASFREREKKSTPFSSVKQIRNIRPRNFVVYIWSFIIIFSEEINGPTTHQQWANLKIDRETHSHFFATKVFLIYHLLSEILSHLFKQKGEHGWRRIWTIWMFRDTLSAPYVFLMQHSIHDLDPAIMIQKNLPAK